MKDYHALLDRVMRKGVDQRNSRTGMVCRILVGQQLTFDLQDGFPAITTKKLAFAGARGELLGFFRGYDNAADFRAIKCNIWDANANSTKSWLTNPHRKGTDDLGRIYGKQWTDWRDKRVVRGVEERDALIERGYHVRLHQAEEYLMERSINQLEEALRKLLTDPSDRRIIISGWNVAELDLMALPPCHMDYRFIALEDARRLDLVMTIRSWDLFLGAPFNIATTSMFLAIMARMSGFTPGSITIQATNAHLYENHFVAVQKQLERDHFPPPKLWLSEHVRQVSLDEIPGAFERIEPKDIELLEYQYHPAIKAKMAE